MSFDLTAWWSSCGEQWQVKIKFVTQYLGGRFSTREENWRTKRKPVGEREHLTVTSTVKHASRRGCTSKVCPPENWGESKKFDGVWSGGTSEEFAGKRFLPRPALFCIDCFFVCWLQFARCQKLEKALHSWGKACFLRLLPLACTLMYDARSEACAYPSLERYNNSLTWSIFSVLSPDLIAYLCWMYFARINSFLSSLKKVNLLIIWRLQRLIGNES